MASLHLNDHRWFSISKRREICDSFSLVLFVVDARVSSAKQRPDPAAQGGLSRPTRQRKVSRSAGPSVAALRKALLISGGECWINKLPFI